MISNESSKSERLSATSEEVRTSSAVAGTTVFKSNVEETDTAGEETLACKQSFEPIKVLENPLDKEYEDPNEYEVKKGDDEMQRLYGFKVSDVKTWPEYLNNQNVYPNDVRNGFTHREIFLPIHLHDTVDPQYLGEFDYETIDTGTSYACDPAPFALISAYDGYYSFEPEDTCAYNDTCLEAFVVNAKKKFMTESLSSIQPLEMQFSTNIAAVKDNDEKERIVLRKSSSEHILEDATTTVPQEYYSQSAEIA